jgi:hypothetical protein
MGDKARAEREAVRTTFEGAISDAFEGPLALYVAEEAKELNAYLEVGGKWFPSSLQWLYPCCAAMGLHLPAVASIDICLQLELYPMIVAGSITHVDIVPTPHPAPHCRA